MNNRIALSAATSLGGLAVALAAFSAPTPATPGNPGAAAPTGQMAASKALFSEKCSACHNLPDPVADPRTRQGWQRTVQMMLTRYHASDSISPTEAAQIVDYLATFAPPSNGPRGGRMSDPWATDPLDVWTVAPTVSRVFNFTSPSSLSRFSPISSGTAGPAPDWQVVTESSAPDGTAAQVRVPKPQPTRFGLLVDRADQAQNMDVQVRFRIVSGKVTPAVGIVFGLTNSKNYQVLAYNQAKDALSLIQIAEPQHTTLQSNPVVLPPSGAATAAQVTAPPAAPAPGWHTLRLLVNNGQVRGWIDHTKRISIADPSYQGGKVGLWAQGDTVAAFKDWTVDIYGNAQTPQGT